MPRVRAIWRSALVAMCALMSTITTPGASAADKVDPAAYPELAPDKLLPAIIADLRRSMSDPYSIRDLVLCPAHHIKLVDGMPLHWDVTFGFNAKNEQGGYTGLTAYAVRFEGGRITSHASPSKMPTNNPGFDRLVNDAIKKDLLKCPSVPDARVHELLDQPLTQATP